MAEFCLAENRGGKQSNRYVVLTMNSAVRYQFVETSPVAEFSVKPVHFPSHWNGVTAAWNQRTTGFSESFNKVIYLLPWKMLSRKFLFPKEFQQVGSSATWFQTVGFSITPLSLSSRSGHRLECWLNPASRTAQPRPKGRGVAGCPLDSALCGIWLETLPLASEEDKLCPNLGHCFHAS